MGANTNIEWPDHTFNPWDGCTKVSPGCDHCYAEARNARFGGGQAINWGPGAPRRRTGEANWKLPLRWNSKASSFVQCPECSWRGQWEEADKRMGCCPQCGHLPRLFTPVRPRIFCSSIADVFDNEVPVQWRADLWALIRSTPNLDWLLLTKRIGNAASMLYDYDEPLPNVWIGATICNQAEADRDIPKLLAVPAAKRFLSIEPLLCTIDLSYWVEGWMCRTCGVARVPIGEHGHCNCKMPDDEANGKQGDHRPGMIDWVIVGGESGPNARPMHPDWARSLRDQCQSAGVPFLFKQWGEWYPRENWSFHTPMHKQCAIKLDGTPVSNDDAPQDVGGHRFERVGKKAAGRLLDGRTWDEVPA